MLFFFFKQKTAYELRISDWSSDVCSSDLHAQRLAVELLGLAHDFVGDRLDVPARGAGGDNHEIADAGLAVDVDLDDVVGLEFGERGADGFEQGVGRRRWIGKAGLDDLRGIRSEEHTSELQSLMRISYAVFCLKKKT